MIDLFCGFVGTLLISVGLFGFVNPHFLGMHLTPVHNVILLVTGALSLFFAFAGQPGRARVFARAFGFAYLLLGILGHFSPDAVAQLLGEGSGMTTGALGPDNLVHLFLGTVLLAVGLIETTGARGHLTRLELAPEHFEPQGRPLR
jgi:hypothetical protein